MPKEEERFDKLSAPVLRHPELVEGLPKEEERCDKISAPDGLRHPEPVEGLPKEEERCDKLSAPGESSEPDALRHPELVEGLPKEGGRFDKLSAPKGILSLSKEGSAAEGKRVLAWAEENGLLERIAGRYYLPYSAVSKELRRLFPQNFANEAVGRAFVRAMQRISREQVRQYAEGQVNLIGLLAAEEANLRSALILAHRLGEAEALLDLLQGLRLVFNESRRYAAFLSLLNLVEPDFRAAEGMQPRAGREKDWPQYLSLHAENARQRGRLGEASAWQQRLVDWYAPLRPEADEQWLAAISTLGDICASAYTMKAVEFYQEAFAYAKEREQRTLVEQRALVGQRTLVGQTTLVGQRALASRLAYAIAESHLQIPAAPDMEQVETWIQTSLGLLDETDVHQRGRCLLLRGKAATERYQLAHKENRPADELVERLNEALNLYLDVLETLPDDAWAELGETYESLGFLYLQADQMLPTAISHYDQAVACKRKAGDEKGAAQAGFHLAVALFLLNDFARGCSYAQAALRRFEASGDESEAEKVRGLLARFPS